MGLYDNRCMVTGLSLKASEVVLVLLHRKGKVHRPISLGVEGTYNRLGSIDSIYENENTRAILRFFTTELATGRFVVEEDYLRTHKAFPFEETEQLLHAFERNINDHSRAAVLDGEPVTFTLIERHVWDGIALHKQELDESSADCFRGVFGQNEVAKAVYAGLFDESDRAGRLRGIDTDLIKMFRVQEFLTEQAIPWMHDDEPGQHYTDDMREYVSAARRKFKKVPLILDAIDQYEKAVKVFLEDEQ